jgi:hypothetical protein
MDEDDHSDHRPAELPSSFAEFVAAAGWQSDQTMPLVPREYTVRGKATASVGPPPLAWHRWATVHIREHGTIGTWRRQRYRYLEHDGWRYWVTGVVINRERV